MAIYQRFQLRILVGPRSLSGRAVLSAAADGKEGGLLVEMVVVCRRRRWWWVGGGCFLSWMFKVIQAWIYLATTCIMRVCRNHLHTSFYGKQSMESTHLCLSLLKFWRLDHPLNRWNGWWKKQQEPRHPSSKILDDSFLHDPWGLPVLSVLSLVLFSPPTCHTAHILLPPELIPKNPNHLMEEIQNNHLGIFKTLQIMVDFNDQPPSTGEFTGFLKHQQYHMGWKKPSGYPLTTGHL